MMVAGAPRCLQMDLLAAVTHESPGLDPTGSLFRIEWVRAVWARVGGWPGRSAALWSWSLGGFRTPPGVYGDERGSPSVLGRERQKRAVHRKTTSPFSKKKDDKNNHPEMLLPETAWAGWISVKHFPASCSRVINSIFSLMTLFQHLLYLEEQKSASLDTSLHSSMALLSGCPPTPFKILQYFSAIFKRVDG